MSDTTRRRRLAGALLVLVLAIIFTGCQDPGPAPTQFGRQDAPGMQATR